MLFTRAVLIVSCGGYVESQPVPVPVPAEHVLQESFVGAVCSQCVPYARALWPWHS